MRRFWKMTSEWILVTAILRERLMLLILGGVATLYLFLSFFEVSVWQCPWRELTGLRCLGCGLTSGCKALLAGRLGEAVAWNWLTPFVVIGFVAAAVVLAVPPQIRTQMLAVIEFCERKYRFVLLLIVLLILQTTARSLGWA